MYLPQISHVGHPYWPHARLVKKSVKHYYWWLPCGFYSLDANAWGLVTHIYFAHSLLWAMPLLDPRLQRAIRRFPELVMAGACLPDLAVVSRRFSQTHQWENAHQLLMNATNDAQVAIAVGYASHLYVDVIAHHHFVPAHEAMWFENKMLTHITSEWAMDGHLSQLVATSPKYLLTQHRHEIARFLAPNFACSEYDLQHALKKLAFWDGWLRFARLPSMIYGSVRRLDRRVDKNFSYYIAKTQVAIENIGTMLNGIQPVFEPELKSVDLETLTAWRLRCVNHLKLQHPLPIRYFEVYSEEL
jgi:hypothetical protein